MMNRRSSVIAPHRDAAEIRENLPPVIQLLSDPKRALSPLNSEAYNHLKILRKSGGRGWDRTSDPYDVNVVLSR